MDVSHPGTPLQVLIANIIRFFNLGHPAAEAVNQALINPEFYLRVVYLFLVFSSFLTSFILGAYIYHKTNDRIAVLLGQLTGLSFLLLPSYNSGIIPVLPVVANVSPEPLFIIIMNLFNLFLLGLYFSEKKSGQSRNVFLLAVVCGLGLAVKLNFVFILLSALLLVPMRRKLLFIAVFMMSFVFFTFPILGKYPQLFHWINDMTVHSSRYGTGNKNFIDWKSFFFYFTLIIRNYWFFVYSALGLWIWSSIRIITDHQNRKARFVWALTFCCLLHIAATAKYFSVHYLLPCFALFGSIFPLFYLSQKNKYKILKPLTAAYILIFVIACAFYLMPYYQKLLSLSRDIHDFNGKISAKYPECSIIPTTTTDVEFFLSQKEVLLRANGSNFRLDSEELSRLYPDSYYFYSEEITDPNPNVESYGIWNFKQRIYGDDIMNICPCAIFIKYTSDFSQYPYQASLLDQSKYLSAFLLVNSSEKLANYLFSKALGSFKNGNYRQALVLGMKSRQLNYEPRGQVEYFLNITYQNLLKSQGH